ncbi:MAG TPA: hypothetical protein VLW52_02780 [Opitutaceae bacterium]|nr:hypothetical protein [Opitutaceae bacterium]
MSLTPEQTQAVAAWVAAGDSLAVIQNKLSEQFHISMTYMDVRFLVDDLGLQLKSAAPKVEADADLSKARPVQAPPEKKSGLLDKLKKAVGAREADAAGAADSDALDGDEAGLATEDADAIAGELPAAAGNVKVDLDRVVRPGAIVSGTVTFSDGVNGKWAMDQYGRLMLDMGKKGYQPSADDVQAFQQTLSRQLQRHGF